MAGRNDAAPVIIKRKKVVNGDGHHGGAWKVAYADFVTAMMAFFMLMWLLNATTEKQRKGIADYFSPTIPLSRISGGGDGSFGGESVFSEDQIAQNGTGASSLKPSEERQALGQTGTSDAKDAEAGKFAERAHRIEEALMGLGGESAAMDNLLRHVQTRLTDEGLVVELSDLEGEPLFTGRTDAPTALAIELTEVVAKVFGLVENPVAINGHIAALPEVLIEDPSWDLSASRAMRTRQLLEHAGMDPGRTLRVTGYADRKLGYRNPMAARNNRIELILIRSDL